MSSVMIGIDFSVLQFICYFYFDVVIQDLTRFIMNLSSPERKQYS